MKKICGSVAAEIKKNRQDCFAAFREAGLPVDAASNTQKKIVDIQKFSEAVDKKFQMREADLKAGYEHPKRVSGIGKLKWDSRIRKANEFGEVLVVDRARRETQRKEFLKVFERETTQEQAAFSEEKDAFAKEWKRLSDVAEEKGVEFLAISD